MSYELWHVIIGKLTQLMHFSFSEIFHFNVSRIFFEMHNLYIIWLYYFQFITCKIVSFVFDATFASSNCQFISIYSCVIGS